MRIWSCRRVASGTFLERPSPKLSSNMDISVCFHAKYFSRFSSGPAAQTALFISSGRRCCRCKFAIKGNSANATAGQAPQ